MELAIITVGLIGVFAGMVLSALLRSLTAHRRLRQIEYPPPGAGGIALGPMGPVSTTDWHCTCGKGRLFREAYVVRVQAYADGHRMTVCDRVLTCESCGDGWTLEEIEKESR